MRAGGLEPASETVEREIKWVILRKNNIIIFKFLYKFFSIETDRYLSVFIAYRHRYFAIFLEVLSFKIIT